MGYVCVLSRTLLFSKVNWHLGQEQGEGFEMWCRATVLLFTSWRDVTDVALDGRTWSELHMQTQFSEEVSKTMKNMQVEWECEDARNESNAESIAFLTTNAYESTDQQVEVNLDLLQLSLSQEQMSSALEGDDSIEHLFVVHDSDRSIDVLKELEQAKIFDLSGISAHLASNRVDLVSDAVNENLLMYDCFMRSIKKHKCMVAFDDDPNRSTGIVDERSAVHRKIQTDVASVTFSCLP